MQLALLILQVLLTIGLLLAWKWLLGLPQAVHDRQKQSVQHELDRELEEIRGLLTRDLELLKIRQAELQIRKTEEFIRFANLQGEFLTDKSLLKKLESGDAKTLTKLKKEMLDLGTRLFFFASDETVLEYGAWKTRSATGEVEGIELLREFGQLMVALRRDLGQQDTALTGDDFLRLIITDWHEHEGTRGGAA